MAGFREHPSNCRSLRRESVALAARAARSRCAAADRLDNQTHAGSHHKLSRPGWPDYTFAFHDGEAIGPVMLARIAKKTGLTPGDL